MGLRRWDGKRKGCLDRERRVRYRREEKLRIACLTSGKYYLYDIFCK
jgi:hypothetical protein